MKRHAAKDSTQDYRILAEARKVSDPALIAKSSRHKAQRIILTEITPKA